MEKNVKAAVSLLTAADHHFYEILQLLEYIKILILSSSFSPSIATARSKIALALSRPAWWVQSDRKSSALFPPCGKADPYRALHPAASPRHLLWFAHCQSPPQRGGNDRSECLLTLHCIIDCQIIIGQHRIDAHGKVPLSLLRIIRIKYIT